MVHLTVEVRLKLDNLATVQEVLIGVDQDQSGQVEGDEAVPVEPDGEGVYRRTVQAEPAGKYLAWAVYVRATEGTGIEATAILGEQEVDKVETETGHSGQNLIVRVVTVEG